MKEIITTIKIDDNGNVIGTSTETKVIEEVKVNFSEPTYSKYARAFDWNSPYWSVDSKFNRDFIKLVETWANDTIRERAQRGGKGKLWLNEIYEKLGLSKTFTGIVAGWVYDELFPVGDNYIEIQIDEHNINGCMMLDFNVDGRI